MPTIAAISQNACDWPECLAKPFGAYFPNRSNRYASSGPTERFGVAGDTKRTSVHRIETNVAD